GALAGGDSAAKAAVARVGWPPHFLPDFFRVFQLTPSFSRLKKKKKKKSTGERKKYATRRPNPFLGSVSRPPSEKRWVLGVRDRHGAAEPNIRPPFFCACFCVLFNPKVRSHGATAAAVEDEAGSAPETKAA
ncbi:unnamed protein product, partial [Ixodes pacificus]